MSCERWEKQAALSVEGDLPENERVALDRHLAGCALCREFTAGLYDSQDALRDLRYEAIGPEVYAGVRQAVLSQIGSTRRNGQMGYAIAAAVVLAAVLAGLSWNRQKPIEQVKQAPAAVGNPHVPAQPVPAPLVHHVARRRHRAAAPLIRASTPAPAQQEPLVVKLVTD